MKFDVQTTNPGPLAIHELLQWHANELWVPEHLDEAQSKVSDFISWLHRDNPEYAGPKCFHPFPKLSPFECAELREKIRGMVQDQRMTVAQAAAILKIDDRRALWLLQNG